MASATASKSDAPMSATCTGCRERNRIIAELRARIAQLEAELAKLRTENERLRNKADRNSRNSSMPPSSDPPDAPKRKSKKRSKRKRGAQKGHPPHARDLFPPEQVDKVVPIVPETCERCQAKLPAQAGEHDLEPLRHQIVDLPDKPFEVVEYQAHSRMCPKCLCVNCASIPADIRAHGIGPRLTAVVAYLSGAHQVSKRGIAEIMQTVFQVPMAVGTVSNLEAEMSEALAGAHAEVADAVRNAKAKNVDETGWKQGAAKRWLWTAATRVAALFVVFPLRSAAGLAALLGTTVVGIITSDRWSVYDKLPPNCRQICWAHLKRDFQKCVDHGGPLWIRVGEGGLKVTDKLFEWWHAFRAGKIDRETLGTKLKPVTCDLRALLNMGRARADDKLGTFCKNPLDLEPALWTFIVEEDVEPTNNHAERVLRRGVLWRKRSFGSVSERGCRFVERILTVVQTLRLQDRTALPYLQKAIAAHRAGQPAPKLLPASAE